MFVKLECGCTIDDARFSTAHWANDGHYPIGLGPASFCKQCDLHRPCLCDQGTATAKALEAAAAKKIDRTFILREGRTTPCCPYCGHYDHAGHAENCPITEKVRGALESFAEKVQEEVTKRVEAARKELAACSLELNRDSHEVERLKDCHGVLPDPKCGCQTCTAYVVDALKKEVDALKLKLLQDTTEACAAVEQRDRAQKKLREVTQLLERALDTTKRDDP